MSRRPLDFGSINYSPWASFAFLEELRTMRIDKLEKEIRKWENHCESENYHDQYGEARYLADVLVKYVSRNIAAKIISEGLVLP